MRISEAVSESVPLAIPFAGGAVLNIEYRPSSVTLAQMEEMVAKAEEVANQQSEEDEASKGSEAQDESEKAQLARLRERLQQSKEALADGILKVVVSWDLTEEDGETVIPLTMDGLTRVPSNVFREITRAVRRHQAAGDEGK